jgi:hypothetical protein
MRRSVPSGREGFATGYRCELGISVKTVEAPLELDVKNCVQDVAGLIRESIRSVSNSEG